MRGRCGRGGKKVREIGREKGLLALLLRHLLDFRYRRQFPDQRFEKLQLRDVTVIEKLLVSRPGGIGSLGTDGSRGLRTTL